MSTQQNLDYAIIPLDSVEVSSNVDGHEAVKLFDGNLQTYWTPSLQQTSFAQVNFLKQHTVKGVDIAFNKGDKRKHTFQIQILSPTTNRWTTISVYETKGTTNEPIRINIPDVVTKSVKVNFLSHIEDGHMGIIPEVSELRVYGEISTDEAPDAAKIPDLPCPQGYVKDPQTNRCMKDVQYEFLNPTNVIGKSTDFIDVSNNDPKNVVNDDVNNSYTVKGALSKITQEFDKEYEITAIDLDIQNPNKAEYHFTLNFLPNAKQVPVLMQADLTSTSVVLDDIVKAKTVELILASTTDTEQKLEVVKMNVLGNVNTTDSPPVVTEPADKGIEKTGYDTDKSKWTAVNMRDDPAKGKIVDVNKKNVRTDFASKDTAQTYLDWAREGVVVDPPVEHICPTGQHWDSTQNKCVDDTTNPPTSGGGVDKFGVKSIYTQTGKIEYNYTLKPNAGLRHNFDAIKFPTSNNEITGYFAIDSAPDDEVSGKWSVTTHSGSNHVKCLDIGVDNHSGACRYRYEDPHPTYTGALGSGIKNGLPLESKFHGWKFIRLTLPDNSVQLEVWQDQGNNEGATPSNQWVQLAKWKVDEKYAVRDYPNGVYAVLRLDGDGIEENLQSKWLSYVEVKP